MPEIAPPEDPEPKPKAKPETPISVGWRLWRAAYLQRYGKPYLGPKADGKTMARIATQAQAEAQRLAPDRPEATDELLAHWFWKYLRDTGTNNFLLERLHGLMWLERDIPSYGEPWSALPKPAAVPAITTEEQRANIARFEALLPGGVQALEEDHRRRGVTPSTARGGFQQRPPAELGLPALTTEQDGEDFSWAQDDDAMGAEAAELLSELQSHAELAPVATARMADELVTHAKTSSVAEVRKAIGDAARTVRGRAAADVPMNLVQLTDLLGRYAANARRPGRRGVAEVQRGTLDLESYAKTSERTEAMRKTGGTL